MKGAKKTLSFKFVWGLLMTATYLLISYLLVCSPLYIGRSAIPGPVRILLAIIFTVYGIYRGYRLWSQR